MKNKKCILIFTLIITFLMVLVTNVQATDDTLTILNIDTTSNDIVLTNNEQTDNTQNNVVNNEETTAPILTTNNTTTNDTVATNTLPQTGIAENTALLVFIAVCVVSAIYAFVKVRNYKNI